MILAQRRERVRQFVDEHRVRYPVLVDDRRDVARAYGVWHRIGLDALNIARPALFVIDGDDRIASIHVAESQGEFPAHTEILQALERR
jgi:peroxiredoxin